MCTLLTLMPQPLVRIRKKRIRKTSQRGKRKEEREKWRGELRTQEAWKRLRGEESVEEEEK